MGLQQAKNDTANALKIGADNSVGMINRGFRMALETLDIQNRNLFELIIWPKNMFNIKSVAMSAIDTIISRLYVTSITVPFISFEYETYNEIKEIKDIVYPTQVTMILLDNEFAMTRTWINAWIKGSIITKPLVDPDGGYVFYDDQESAKKNALLTPVGGLGLPNPGGWFKFEGLKPMSMDELTFEHNTGDPMLLTVNFSVDNVWMKTIGNFFE
jgi:hypothetical protein